MSLRARISDGAVEKFVTGEAQGSEGAEALAYGR
jgi:hypothetical protein